MEEEIDIKNLLIELWRKKWIVVIVTIICTVLGILKYGNVMNKKMHTTTEKKVTTSKKEDLDVASITFYLGYSTTSEITTNGQEITEVGEVVDTVSSSKTKSQTKISSEIIATCNSIIKSNELLQNIIYKNGLDIEEKELENLVGVSQVSTGNLLSLYVGASSEEVAKILVLDLFDEIKASLKNIYDIDDVYVSDSVHLLDNKEIESLANTSSEDNGNVTAVTSSETNGSNVKKIVLVGLMGFIGTCAIIVIFEIFNDSIKDVETLEKVTKLKTLTTLSKKDVNNQDKIKLLRVNINECNSILITSASKGDGKTYVAENLAKSFAKLNKKVLLLDIVKNESSLLKKYDGKGLADFLKGQDKFIEKYAVESNVKNLSIILAGHDEGTMTELLESSKMQETLSTLERLYDVIIIDSENVVESANTLAIAKIAKYSILVSCERKTKIADIIKAKNNIEDLGGNVIGNVLNKSYKA